MIKLTKDSVVTRLSPEPEERSPEHYESVDGLSDGYAATVREMMKKHKSAWNWCCAKVSARPTNSFGFFGTAYLGACSYINRENFINVSGHYYDMIDDAVAELNGQIQHQITKLVNTGVFADNVQIANDLEFLADGQDDELGRLMVKAAKALRFQRTDE